MPTQHVITYVQDPWWPLQDAIIALLLALPMTIGAHLARARRSAIAVTFAIAWVALLAGHYVAPLSMNQWGLFAEIAAELVILFLGVRFILGTKLLAASVLAFVTILVQLLVVLVEIAMHIP
jgi:hypothetical protein